MDKDNNNEDLISQLEELNNSIKNEPNIKNNINTNQIEENNDKDDLNKLSSLSSNENNIFEHLFKESFSNQKDKNDFINNITTPSDLMPLINNLENNLTELSKALKNEISKEDSNLKNEELKNNENIFESLFKNNQNSNKINDDGDILKLMNIFSKYMNIDKEEELTEDKQKELSDNVLNYLIECNLLKDSILRMKESIVNSYNSCKNNIDQKEKEKYEQYIKWSDIILNESNKENPDKVLIGDILYKLQDIIDLNI